VPCKRNEAPLLLSPGRKGLPAQAVAAAMDELQGHSECVSARPFTSVVAVVDAGSGSAFETRPSRY
jgi:hypothetical protein